MQGLHCGPVNRKLWEGRMTEMRRLICGHASGAWWSGVVVGMTLFGAEQVLADRVPPPRMTLTASPAAGCPKTALDNAVESKRDDVRECLSSGYVQGKVTLSCSFADSGRVKGCTQAPGSSGFKSKQISCLSRLFATLSLPTSAWNQQRPSLCHAQIEITMQLTPYRRPRPRPSGDLIPEF